MKNFFNEILSLHLIVGLICIFGCGGGGSDSTSQEPPPITDSMPVLSTSLSNYLNAIDYGVKDDGNFKTPSSSSLQSFENIVMEVLATNYQQAHTLAKLIGYELIDFTDTDSSKKYYLLREVNPIPSSSTIGGGYYLFNPAATYQVAIHVPHPKHDQNTNIQGIDLYLSADVEYLFLAGSHRRSSQTASDCQNVSDYRVSDVVHNEDTFFYRAHKALEAFNSQIISVELHGFGTSSLENLQSQCDATSNPRLVNLSETRSDLDRDTSSLMHDLESIINQDGQIRACVYSLVLDSGENDIYSRSLGGTLNTLGRLTNGSPDTCNTPALDELNTHRYLHIEQSATVRSENRELMNTYIKQAIENYFNRREQ